MVIPVCYNSVGTDPTNEGYRDSVRQSRAQLNYWIAIFCGAISGVVRGKVTVKTPSLIDALISSGWVEKVGQNHGSYNTSKG